MNIPKKTISQGLLTYIGVQALVVGASLTYHYAQPHAAPIVLTIEAPRYTLQDILYGAITKPRLNYPIDSSQRHTKELGITLIGPTTGPSGDCALIFPV